jgi:hypothetical protein
MRLTVHLHRQTKYEPEMGTIRAYIVQGNLRGRNILAGRQISNAENARQRARAEVWKKAPGAEIEFWEEL